MDYNKKIKLDSVGFVISDCCELCKNGRFPSEGSMWGTCRKHYYQHQKHSMADREIGIHRCGFCNDYEIDDALISRLGAFSEYWRADHVQSIPNEEGTGGEIVLVPKGRREK